MRSSSPAAHSLSRTRPISRRSAGTTSLFSRRTRHACERGLRRLRGVSLSLAFSEMLLTIAPQIPERMPPCPGGHCICAWQVSPQRSHSSSRLHDLFRLWLANNGTANFYMSALCFFASSVLSPDDRLPQPASTATSPARIHCSHDRSSRRSTPCSVLPTIQPVRQRQARRGRCLRTIRPRTSSGKGMMRDRDTMRAGRLR